MEAEVLFSFLGLEDLGRVVVGDGDGGGVAVLPGPLRSVGNALDR